MGPLPLAAGSEGAARTEVGKSAHSFVRHSHRNGDHKDAITYFVLNNNVSVNTIYSVPQILAPTPMNRVALGRSSAPRAQGVQPERPPWPRSVPAASRVAPRD